MHLVDAPQTGRVAHIPNLFELVRGNARLLQETCGRATRHPLLALRKFPEPVAEDALLVWLKTKPPACWLLSIPHENSIFQRFTELKAVPLANLKLLGKIVNTVVRALTSK
jgi:hypothetical protein